MLTHRRKDPKFGDPPRLWTALLVKLPTVLLKRGEEELLIVTHGRVQSPNDPKLSDSGPGARV